MRRWTTSLLRLLGRAVSRAPSPEGYDAFISYSHAGDDRVAPVLRRALHAFARPFYRIRALRIYLDKESLSANPGLWSAIQQTFATTRFLILLASPEAARSEWVAREVDHWCRHKSSADLVLVVTDGEVRWDRAAGDFDWRATTALPPVLRGAFDEEPLWVDLRFARGADRLSPRDPRLREAVATVAARIHGRDRDRLIGDDIRQYRVRIALATGAATTVAAFGAVAAWQWIEARAQRDLARDEAAIARSRQLAAQAQRALQQGRLDRGLLLAVGALGFRDTAQARDVLLEGLESAPELVAFLPGGPTTATAFSADGRMLAAGHEDGTITLWDAVALRRRGRPLAAHSERVTSLAFSPDGETIVSGGADGRLVVRDLRTGARRSVSVGASLAGFAFAENGALLVSGDFEGAMQTWDLATLRRRGRPLRCGGGVTAIAVAPDGRTFAWGSLAGVVGVARLGSRTPRCSVAPGGGVHSLAFVDRRRLAVGAHDGTIVLEDLRGRKRRRLSRGHRGIVTALASTGAGTLASAGDDGAVLVWDLAEGSARQLRGVGQMVLGLGFRHDGEQLASAGPEGGLILWDVHRRDRLARPLSGHEAGVTNVAFGRDGATMASADGRGEILLWDLGSRSSRPTRLARLRAGVAALSFAPDGLTLAAASTDRTIAVWNARTRARTATLSPANPVRALAFADEGRLLVSGDVTGELASWDLRTGDGPTSLGRADGGIWSLAVDSRGEMVASGDERGRILLWPIGGNGSRRSLGRHGDDETVVAGVAFSPDAELLVSVGQGVQLWDVHRRRRVARLAGHADVVNGAAFSPDGRMLATAGSDQAVRLWDVETRQALGNALVRRFTAFATVAFSPDGRRLAAGGSDRIVVVWIVALDDWRALACATANRDLDEQEWLELVGAGVPYETPCAALRAP